MRLAAVQLPVVQQVAEALRTQQSGTRDTPVVIAVAVGHHTQCSLELRFLPAVEGILVVEDNLVDLDSHKEPSVGSAHLQEEWLSDIVLEDVVEALKQMALV